MSAIWLGRTYMVLEGWPKVWIHAGNWVLRVGPRRLLVKPPVYGWKVRTLLWFQFSTRVIVSE